MIWLALRPWLKVAVSQRQRVRLLTGRVAASSTGARLARGVFWSFAGTAISRGLALAATVIVARVLGTSEFGELGMIQSTVGMLGVFAGFGLGLTATKHVAEFRHTDPQRAGRILGLSSTVAVVSGGVMAALLLGLAPWLAVETLDAPHLSGPLRVGALVLFFSALNGAQTGALAGFEAFRTIARVNVIVGVASFPILLAGAYLGRLPGVVWALAVNLALHWGLNHIALRREAKAAGVPFSTRFTANERQILLHFSLPSAASGLLIAPAHWIGRTLLIQEPGGYAALGLLTAALSFQALVLFVSGALSAPLLSMISGATSAGPPGRPASETAAAAASDSALPVVNMLASWTLGIYAALPLLAFPELAELVFGEGYSGHAFRVTTVLVVLTTAVMTYKAGLARVLAARNLLWWGVGSNILWALTSIGLAVPLVRYGAAGLAGSILVAYIVNALLLVPLYSRRRLVPPGTLLSGHALLIWAVVAALGALVPLHVPLIWRAVALPATLAVSTWAFYRIYVDSR